ncbi:MAG: septal ring lytic transglycosylase RlpA family protein [Psychromonas sp.]
MNIKRLIIIFLSFNLLACAPIPVAESAPQEVGNASFYHNKFQGKRTASGDIFRQNTSTAAHKKLPFGTKVKVTNLKNGKSVVVKINDRGPFVKGRVIDLSRSAFKAINGLSAGVIKVRIEVLR